jgi:hypothetical protein
MSIHRREGSIVLEGICPVDDAEPLLQMVQATPGASVDWSQCRQLHTAVLQVILASGAVPIGPCGDGWMERWFVPGLTQTAR